MCFHGVPSHNFTFFHHSYTCGIDWPLTCLTGSMGPALSGLSRFFFYSLQDWCMFRDSMPIGKKSMLYDKCWTVVQILARKAVPSEIGVCVCLRVRLHAYNYLIGVIHKTSGSHAKHVWFTRIHAADLGQQLPAKQQIVNFQFFSDQTAPQIGRKNPQLARKNPQTGANQDFCPDVFWQNVFYRSKARFKWQNLLILQSGSATRRHTKRLIADCIAVAILGMLFNTLSGSDSSSWGPVLRLSRGYRSAFQLGIS